MGLGSEHPTKKSRGRRACGSGHQVVVFFYFYCIVFLPVHDSSITDLVSNSVTQGSGFQGLQSTAEQSKTFDLSYNWIKDKDKDIGSKHSLTPSLTLSLTKSLTSSLALCLLHSARIGYGCSVSLLTVFRSSPGKLGQKYFCFLVSPSEEASC